jgi:hypothetical protein
MDAAVVRALADRLARAPEPAALWSDNLPAAEAFLVAASQWRTSLELENGRLKPVFIGLDYAGAAVAWGAHGFALSSDLFRRLRIMEAAARAALNGVG